jgi:mannose-6-phosphate isomerase-like protein (cupin superfamily)
MTQDLSRRLVRYADLRPCTNAFVDSRSPGSDRKENFTIIGPGVSENPNQYVHIPEPHGFNIGAARQPGGCLNSQHSHETAEVFVVHTGQWRFVYGVKPGEDGHVDMGPGDVISIPIHMFRGFEKRDEGVGFLFAVLGGDDPGKVTWAPQVFDLAAKYGLVLLKGGKLVDTTIGESVPAGAEREQPPSADVLARLATPAAERLKGTVVTPAELKANPASPLAGPGVEEAAIITPKATKDGFQPGPISGWWPHGFNLRRLTLASGARVPAHVRHEEEVIFVHDGMMEVETSEGTVVLGPGDTFTTPKGLDRAFRGLASTGTAAYVVRGGDEAGAVEFLARKAA